MNFISQFILKRIEKGTGIKSDFSSNEIRNAISGNNVEKFDGGVKKLKDGIKSTVINIDGNSESKTDEAILIELI